MKKLLSVLLSFMFCVSVAGTYLSAEKNLFEASVSEQKTDAEYISPCDESTLPGFGGEGQG